MFTLLTVARIRQWMVDALPPGLSYSFGVGIGLFLTFIGLNESGIVTVGVPGAFCWGKTDVNGNYQIDLAAVSASPGQFELYFILQPYAVDHSVKQQVNGVVRIDFKMHP